MDPVSVELLLAVVGGVAGAAGTEAWQGLVALVRRPFAHSPENEDTAALGLDALAALQQESGNWVAAAELAAVLQARAEVDASFGDAMQAWLHQAHEAFPTSAGDTRNEITGGRQHGHVLMGRDFSSITISDSATAAHPVESG
jgi:hypothetical protein